MEEALATKYTKNISTVFSLWLLVFFVAIKFRVFNYRIYNYEVEKYEKYIPDGIVGGRLLFCGPS